MSAATRDTLAWRALSAILLAGVVFSTGLHLTVGPESMLTSRWYTAPPSELQDWHGSGGQLPAVHEGLEAWRLTNFRGDAGYYLRQAEHPDDSIAPYRYRIVVPTLAGVVSETAGASPAGAFVFVNLVSVLAAALLLQWHLERDHGTGRALSLVGALLLVTVLPVTATVGFPMVDAMSVLVGVGLLVALYRRQWLLAGAIGAAGVLVKEVAVVASPLIVVGLLAYGGRSSRAMVRAAVGAALPVAMFAGARLVMGGGAFEANYGVDLTAGLPDYWRRVVTDPLWLGKALLFAFGPLWLGVIGAMSDRRLRVLVPTMAGMVATSAVVLSSGIGRVLGIVAPFLVVGAVVLVAQAVSPTDDEATVTDGRA